MLKMTKSLPRTESLPGMCHFVKPVTVALVLAIGIFPLLVATVIPAWAIGVIDPDEAIRG